mgnify:CR=1 FL=1
MAQHAVIRTGGKQYLVEPGKKYPFERLPGEPGAEVTFDDVLLTFGESAVDARVGQPLLAGVTVRGRVIRQGRTRKITVVKYKAKSRYRRKLGHRQQFTEVEIQEIASAPSVVA